MEPKKKKRVKNHWSAYFSCTGMTIVSCAIVRKYIFQMLASVKTNVLFAEQPEHNESNTWNHGTMLGCHILALWRIQ